MLPEWCLRSNRNQLPVAIIGGGLAGLALSIGLSRHGIPHKIYESAECFGQVGAGVAMGPNALAAIELIDPRLRECFQRCSITNADPEKSNVWLSFRHGMAVTPGSDKEVAPYDAHGFGSIIAEVEAHGPTERGRSCVHRGALLDEMVRLIPGGVAAFGKQLVDLDDTGFAVKLTFKDGSLAWASAVIACDGIRSVVRRNVLESDPDSIEPVFADEYCYRRLVPLNEARRLLGDDMALNGNIFCGYNGYVTTYPVQLGCHSFINMVAVRRQETQDWAPNGEWLVPCTVESISHDFEGWGKPILELLKGIETPQKWGLFDSKRAKTYARGRICLIGDAAHASTPHQGAGAGMAFEDAGILSQLLHRSYGVGNIAQAFQVFDKIRRPRTQRLVATSRAAGRVFEFSHEGIMDDTMSVREDLMARHLWIWNFNIRQELEEADMQYDAMVSNHKAHLMGPPAVHEDDSQEAENCIGDLLIFLNTSED